MLVCRTPFRISLFGGGSDFPEWFNLHNGATISFTIDKYCYVTLRKLPPLYTFKYRLRYFKSEMAQSISQIRHPSIKGAINTFDKTKDSFEIVHSSDIPGLSGLGSSSAFSVSLINLIHNYNNIKMSKKKLAKKAIYLEKKVLKETIGYQDQYACAYGGFNSIDYSKQKIIIKPIKLSNKKRINLINNSLIVYTGLQRKSQYIEKDKIKNIKKNEKNLMGLVELCNEAKKILNSNSNTYIYDINSLMRESWNYKKLLSSHVSNKKIEDLYEYGLKNGALSGKILGAGGGGFMLFLTKNSRNKLNLIKKLKNFKSFSYKMDYSGSKIIFRENRDNN